MIYIDPPYNSGSDFIYPDKYQDNLDTYLKYTKQIDNEGLKFSSNTESEGRFHTNWINMIYPRIKIAKSLLRPDGLIFISIDSRELANLKLVCNEVFGDENCVAEIVWKNKTGGGAKTKGWIGLHEYILCYANNYNVIEDITIPYPEKTASMYNKKDEHYETRGPYATWPLDTTSMGDRPNLRFPIFHKGDEIWPGKQWLWSKGRVQEAQKNNMLVFNEQADGTYKIRFKGYLKDENSIMRRGKPLSILEGPYTQEGSKDFQKLMPKSVFPFPKPVALIKKLIEISTDETDNTDGIVMDFFAGSGTTAQAAVEYNASNNTNINFICIQLPEPLEENNKEHKAPLEYCRKNNLSENISSITKERMIKASSNITIANSTNIDLGFKVFKLDSSNIRVWNPDRKDLEQTLIDHMEHLVEGRSEEDVLYELLLKRGVDLTVPIETREITTKGTKNTKKEKESVRGFRDSKKVFSIGYGVLFACLDTKINRDQIEDLAMAIINWHKELEPAGDTQVVFRDSAFEGDIAKTNMTAILEQHGIKHVKSL